ncbi:MAG TPA: hypothetical protein VFJ90_08675 [Candidatus Didemnitutus sp.]|nr:hypothetical protein [Candidatus Didemnitutus sp.]
MHLLSPPFVCAAVLAAATTAFAANPAAQNPPAPREAAPVSVSSINYSENNREALLRLDVEKSKVNPATKTLEKNSASQRYVLVPGETYEADISYDEICRLLNAALEKKGFVNAVDGQGRVLDPEHVDLVLRVSSGERTWRLPTARIDHLTWNDGMVPRPRGRTLATLGGDVAWEFRAGGNDLALGAAAVNADAPRFGFGSSPASPAGATSLTGPSAMTASQVAAGVSAYEATRDFYLIVVDAFSYPDLKNKGEHARRVWTTFLAAPRQPGQKFSDALSTLLRVGTPYFGETTSGLQMFDDARAHVDIGTPHVVESDAKPAERK